MHPDLQTLSQKAFQALETAVDLASLEACRVALLGKKGLLSEWMQSLGDRSLEEKRTLGSALNTLKQEIQDGLASRKALLEAQEIEARCAREAVDITLPVYTTPAGTVHPTSQALDEMLAIFSDMGFTVRSGPHIETDFHNFTALNVPDDHPARQEHDTFYLPPAPDGSTLLLRTHTSPVQIRTLLQEELPLRIVAPGRVFRADSDATHTPMFHQIEGLVIDRHINMGHLKASLEAFFDAFFGIKNLPMRMRPSYFPFTEPSAEVDIGCTRDGNALKIGGADWLEVLGCGMVHPEVLRHCNLDPAEWQGFAWGMGVDRMAMLKYGISDLRTFFEGDLRWLRHYGFSSFDLPSPLLAPAADQPARRAS